MQDTKGAGVSFFFMVELVEGKQGKNRWDTSISWYCLWGLIILNCKFY